MHGEDVVKIIGVVNSYALAVDTQRWEIFDNVFTSDVEADFGGGFGWHGLDALKRDFALAHAGFKATQHVTTNHNVVVNNESANCLSYVHGHFIRDLADGGNKFESGGWYDDSLVRTGAGWRIKHRICRMIWWTGNPKVMPGPVADQMDSLRADAAAGAIRYLKVVAGR